MLYQDLREEAEEIHEKLTLDRLSSNKIRAATVLSISVKFG
jgi:hypothetical protein